MINELIKNKLKNFKPYNLDELSGYNEAIDNIKKKVIDSYKIDKLSFLLISIVSLILIFAFDTAGIYIILAFLAFFAYVEYNGRNIKFSFVISVIAFVAIVSILITAKDYNDPYSYLYKIDYNELHYKVFLVVFSLSFLYLIYYLLFLRKKILRKI